MGGATTDQVRKRVFYPVLLLDCNPSSFNYVTAGGYVWSATGSAPWTSYTAKQFASYFDTAGVCQKVLAQNASSFPLRTFPKMTAGPTLACVQGILLNGATPPCAMSSHKPTQDQLESFNLLVMPYILTGSQSAFLEHTKMFKPFYYTPLQNFANSNSFQSFAILNANMLSSVAKEFLDDYDKYQEQDNASWGWVSTGATLAAAAAMGKFAPTAMTVYNTVDRMAFSWLLRNQGRSPV